MIPTGHALGDQVLVSFTQTIQKQLRKIDVFGRLGGEEFCVLLLEVNLAQALSITERLRKAVEALQVPFESSHISITASFGIAFSPHLDEADLTFEKLLNLADEALYRAKENGRNSVMI
jgi:diguanylate cyclase (GGDEF)-like protein